MTRPDRFQVTLNPILASWVRLKAESDGVTVSEVVEKALESYKAAIQDAYARTGRR